MRAVTRVSLIMSQALADAIAGSRNSHRPSQDVYCSDGVISHGHRRITKGGGFRFAGTPWRTPLLAPFVGSYLGITASDVMLTRVSVWTTYPGGAHLMDLEVVLVP